MSKVMRIHFQKVVLLSMDAALTEKLNHKFLIPTFLTHNNLAQSCNKLIFILNLGILAIYHN